MGLRPASILPAIVLGLGGCGDYLGDYEVEGVRVVRALPPDAFDGGSPPPYPQYVRIELSSQANLNAAETGGGLYTDADFCPFRDANRIVAFGPVASDGKPVESWKRRGPLSRDSRDGRYHYFVYVVPSSPPRKLFDNSTDEIPGYDIRAGGRDLCFRFIAPGYNIIASRSGIVRVAGRSIGTARE